MCGDAPESLQLHLLVQRMVQIARYPQRLLCQQPRRRVLAPARRRQLLATSRGNGWQLNSASRELPAEVLGEMTA